LTVADAPGELEWFRSELPLASLLACLPQSSAEAKDERL
jgi:hypothetical protein